MSKPITGSMLDAVNELNEISAQVLYLAVSVAHAWDDRPGDGLSYILMGLHDRITAAAEQLSEAVKASVGDEPPEPPPFEPTPEMEAIARRFREDWDRAGRDAAAKMKASLDVPEEEAAHG